MIFWPAARLGLLAGLVVAAAAAATAAVVELAAPAPSPHELVFGSAEDCGACHSAIFEEWQRSWMAAAFTNKMFQLEFQRFQELAPELGENPLDCLRCHAPAALLTTAEDQRQPLLSEGVTCEVCHRVAHVRWDDDQAHLVIDPSDTVYGSRAIAAGVGVPHPVRSTDVWQTSEVCAGCHHDRRGNIFLERTYTEWQNSSYAEADVGCVDCHMPKAAGPATDNKPLANAFHLSHTFPGGHFGSELLSAAAELEVVDLTSEGLILAVENTRVGHHFPTGGIHPTELRLKVVGNDANGAVLFEESRVYALNAVDDAGNPAGALTPVAGVVDTTIAPEERRIERFAFGNLPALRSLSAGLSYVRYAGLLAAGNVDAELEPYVAPIELARCNLAWKQSLEHADIACDWNEASR